MGYRMFILKYCYSQWSRLVGRVSVLFIQGGSRGKVNVLRGDFTATGKGEVHKNICLILNGNRNTAAGIDKHKSIAIGNKKEKLLTGNAILIFG